jgi:Flp pilus assembly protein TadG
MAGWPGRARAISLLRKSGATAERGFVTAETALVLPSLVGLGVALAFIVTAAADELRCSDAAWEAARGLARGESSGYALRAAQRLGPAGASVLVDSGGGSVQVRVSARLVLGGAILPALHVNGHAQVSCEPGTGCAADGVQAGAR